MTRRVPSSWVSSGHGTPDVCARHGKPATRRYRLSLVSSPPDWSWLFLIGGVLIFFIVRAVTRKTVEARMWPFCEQCGRLRIKQLVLGWSVAVGGAALIVWLGTAAYSAPGDVQAAAIGVTLVVAGVLFGLTFTGWQGITRAKVSQDGMWVTFRKPHPAFEAQLPD
jgi:hypothetical protein